MENMHAGVLLERVNVSRKVTMNNPDKTVDFSTSIEVFFPNLYLLTISQFKTSTLSYTGVQMINNFRTHL